MRPDMWPLYQLVLCMSALGPVVCVQALLLDKVEAEGPHSQPGRGSFCVHAACMARKLDCTLKLSLGLLGDMSLNYAEYAWWHAVRSQPLAAPACCSALKHRGEPSRITIKAS